MRRGNLFWGIILIVFGILFLLNNLGILKIDVWGLIWPSLLIVAGIFVLWNVLAQSQHHAETRQVAIPLEGAAAAEVRI